MARLRGGQYPWVEGVGQAIGLRDDWGKWIAGTIFYNCNGQSLWLSVAAVPGRQWLNKAYLWTCFAYPFKQLGVWKVFAEVAEANKASRGFVERLGFRLEATLKDADPSGDILVFSMTRKECRWLNIKVNLNEQRRTASSP